MVYSEMQRVGIYLLVMLAASLLIYMCIRFIQSFSVERAEKGARLVGTVDCWPFSVAFGSRRLSFHRQDQAKAASDVNRHFGGGAFCRHTVVLRGVQSACGNSRRGCVFRGGV